MAAEKRILNVGQVLDAAKHAAPADDLYDLSKVRQHAERFVHLLHRLSDAVDNGERKRTRARARAILTSYSARFCAAVLQAKKLQMGPAEAHALAERIDCWREADEPVRVYFKRNASGGRRPICKFGPERRTRQVLVREVLIAIHGHSRFDYAAKSRGRDAACRRWRDNVNEGGRWYVIADVKNCFNSIRTDNLHLSLRLPRSVVRHCLTIHEAPIYGPCTPSLETAACAGIPQGSLASPFVAALLIQMVLKDISTPFAISYADDLLLRAANAEDAEAISHALGEALLRHPHGPLQLKSLVASRIGKPNDFLGMKVRRNAPWDAQRFRAIPSQPAFSRMKERLRTRLASTEITDLEGAYAYAKRWGNSFGEWKRTRHGDHLLFNTASWIWEDCKHAIYEKLYPANE